MALIKVSGEVSKSRYLKALVAGLAISAIASSALADELSFNLHLIVHDYGRLAASAQACKSPLDLQPFRQEILDVAGTDPSLDSDSITTAMNAAVQKQSLRMPGCSKAGMEVARQHFDRDLKDFQYAVENK